jgi:sRNA-binding protein
MSKDKDGRIKAEEKKERREEKRAEGFYAEPQRTRRRPSPDATPRENSSRHDKNLTVSSTERLTSNSVSGRGGRP